MSDIYTSSSMTTLSVVACSTTTSSVVASISGQDVSLITTTAGSYTVCRLCMYLHIPTVT